LVALLAMTAAGAAIGRWDRGWVSRLGALVVFLLYLSSSGFVADAVRAMGTGQFLGIGVAALLLLVWSFRRPTELHGRPTAMGWLSWRGLAHHEPVLRAWYSERLGGAMRLIVPMVFFAGALISPFVPGQGHRTSFLSLYLVLQVIVLWIAVHAWQAQEQHWRYRLLPTLARRRPGLALKLWWAQCRWVVPCGAALALVSGLPHHNWPEGMDSLARYQNILRGLPWLMANLAMLVAIATLWVGVRRSQRLWDWLFVPLGIGAPFAWDWINGGGGDRILDWSGRIDVLTAMVVSTLLVLTLATWVWQRGSLSGMERWSAAGQSAGP